MMSEHHRNVNKYLIELNNIMPRDKSFYVRQRQIKRMLKIFIQGYKTMHHPSYVGEYKRMDKIRLDLKRLFDIQAGELYNYPLKYTNQYYKMLDQFKYYYSLWKHWTYYTYLHVRFDVPFHIMKQLKYYRRTGQSLIGGVFL